MIVREHDTALIERVGNSEHVKPFVISKEGPIDWLRIIKGCAVLSNGEDAVGIFEETSPRIWEAHILFDKTHRGKQAEATAREMISYMMPKHADAIWGAVPMANRPARLFLRRIGATPIPDDESEVELFYMRNG